MEKYTYYNPIISGYYPDPSVVRVNDDFYLVNSSFEFFPGVPLFHSKNLVNWNQVGYCLTKKTQLPLEESPVSMGILAPTIRHHNGTYYMITTNITELIKKGRGNFIVKTTNPLGEWSDPVWIDHEGIDPSLFFDEDGKAYYCGTGFDEKGQAIVLFEIDVETGAVLSEKKSINYGCCGKCPEAPHIYKINGMYYLLLAEGGTEYGHMVTIQRSTNIWGPYESCPFNPILTHRDYNGEPIQCVGHADLFDDTNGNWWMVALGTRNNNALLHHLGRETFLVPVTWEQGWPMVKDKKVSLCMEALLPQKPNRNKNCFITNFTEKTIPNEFNYVRNPETERYAWDSAQGKLVLNGNEKGLSRGVHSPTFMGIRQKDFCCEVLTKLEIPSHGNTKAGLTVYYMDTHHYDIQVSKEEDGVFVELNKCIYDFEAVVNKIPVTGNEIYLKIISDEKYYTFFYSMDGKEYIEIGRGMTAAMASEITEVTTFTGTYFGMFAQKGAATFRCFEYKWDESSRSDKYKTGMTYPGKE